MKPIDVNIVFKYGQEIQKLTEALKNAGKVSVTFDYTVEVAKLKSAISNAVSSVPVTLSIDATIVAFKQKFDEVITNAPISLAWDKTLEGFKSALNSINNAPIEIKLQYESQLEHLRTEASKAFAGIAVEAEFVNTHPTKIVEKIQSVINDPEHGLSMFNDQSRFNRAKLVKYIQSLSREINNITSSSQYSIHVPTDLGDLNKKLQDSMPSLEAGVLVPSVPIDMIRDFADTTAKAITDLQIDLAARRSRSSPEKNKR